jgi:hypothetical protein
MEKESQMVRMIVVVLLVLAVGMVAIGCQKPSTTKAPGGNNVAASNVVKAPAVAANNVAPVVKPAAPNTAVNAAPEAK